MSVCPTVSREPRTQYLLGCVSRTPLGGRTHPHTVALVHTEDDQERGHTPEMMFVPAAPGFAIVFEEGTENEWNSPLVGWDTESGKPQPLTWDVNENDGKGGIAYAADYWGTVDIRETE